MSAAVSRCLRVEGLEDLRHELVVQDMLCSSPTLRGCVAVIA